MTTFSLVRAEFGRLTATKLGRVAFVALMCVPLLYGGLYLWGNQNPYANLNQVPAALVVSDTGATVDGAHVNYGKTIQTSLLKDNEFDWQTMSATEAQRELKNGGVDFVVTLPASFSTDLASVSTTTPTRASVQLATNDANSYLSSTIAGQAATAIRASVVGEVGTTAAKQLLVGLADVRTSLSKAADGASTLADGTTSTADGASTLAAGAKTLQSGAATLTDGLDTLQSSSASLPSSTKQLAAGAASVQSGAVSVKSGSASLSSGLAKIDAGATSTAKALQQRLAADGLTAAQIEQALAILEPGATAVHSAATSAATLSSGAAKVASGAATVTSGAKTLNASAPSLTTAIASAASGAASVESGAASTTSGANTLAAGAKEVDTGAKSLATQLADGVTEIPATTAAERTTQSNAIGDPAAVATTKVTSAGSYGAGLAPFFLSLAIWIGCYALFLIIRPLSRRALTALRAPVRISLAGWLTPTVIGCVQVVALFAIATLALGFGVVHPFGMLGVLFLSAGTYAAILLALNAVLGSVGQFLGLILMLIQLVTAGGTFPWQTLPAPLAALHHALPMSYSVDALRQVMYGGNLSLAWSDVTVLAAWLLGALLLTMVVAARMTRHRTLRDLQPSLIGG